MLRNPKTGTKGTTVMVMAAAYLAILVAFGLRLWRLTDSPLWYDETFTVYHAGLGPISSIVASLQNDNAFPLHTWLLSMWVMPAGQSEFVVRFSSVLIGVMAIPLVGRWAGEMTARRVSVGAMLATATLPIIVYYAQEVRYPGLAFTLAALFGWLAWRLWYGKDRLWGYVLAGVGMLLAHTYTGFLWTSFLVLSVIARLIRRDDLPARQWWTANVALVILAAPIAGWTLWRSQIDATAFSPTGWDMPRWLPVQYGVGDYLPRPWASLFPIIALISIVVGCWLLVQERRWTVLGFLLFGLTLPVGLLLLASRFSGKWEPRYLLPSWGLAFVIGVGLGWDMPRRWKRLLGVILGALWVAMGIPAIDSQAQGRTALMLRDATHPRPDFRAVAGYIEENGGPNDAIVVVAGPAAHTLDYHYGGDAPITGLPDTMVFDTSRPVDLRAMRDLEASIGDAERLWLVLWQADLVDPAGAIQTTLMENCRRLGIGGNFFNMDLLLFDLTPCRPLGGLVDPAHPVDADFGNIHLVGYDLKRTPDGMLILDLWWEAAGGTPDTNYTTFVHLFDASGELISQDDRPPGTALYPTAMWQSGVYVRMRHTLALPDGGACEGCLLSVGLYNEEGRLPLVSGASTGADAVTIPVWVDDSE